MKKFIFLYFGGEQPKNEEELKKEMELWMTWLNGLKSEGILVDMGSAFADNGKEVSAKETLSLTPKMWPALGYNIIQTDNIEKAVEISKGCPSFNQENTVVRVFEFLDM